MEQKQELIYQNISNSSLHTIHSHESTKKEDIQSEYYQDYLSLIKIDSSSETSDKISYEALITRLFQGNIFKRGKQFKEFSISIMEQSRNKEMLSLKVQYGYFQTVFSVLIIDEESPAHSLQNKARGNFATTYKTEIFDEMIAIKCHEIKDFNFQNIFRNVIKEYFLLSIASNLRAGPGLSKKCGFDIIVYRNCMQFSMQFCDSDLSSCQNVQLDLKQSLQSLHSFGLIHFDIKPDNICYSCQYKKAVFIDYGLSELVKEPSGFKSFKSFRGSLTYCSSEMQRCFFQGSKPVDVYYNDAVALVSSLKHLVIKQGQFFISKDAKDQITCNLTQQYLVTIIKHHIFDDQYQNQELNKLFMNYEAILLPRYRQEIIDILRMRPFFENSNSIYKKYLKDQFFEGVNFYSKTTSDYCSFEFSNLSSEDDLYDQINPIVLTKNQDIHCISKHYSTFLDCRFQAKLKDIQFITNLQRELYYLILANSIKIDDGKSNFQEKQTFAQFFFDFMKLQPKQASCLIQTCIEFLFDFAFTTPETETKIQIIYELIISIIVFQTKSEEEIIESLDQVLTASIDPDIKGTIIYKYLIALRWVHGKHKTKYNIENITFQFWQKVRLFIIQQKQQAIKIGYLYMLVVFKYEYDLKSFFSMMDFSQLSYQVPLSSIRKKKILNPIALQIQSFCIYMVYSQYYQQNSQKRNILSLLQRKLSEKLFYNRSLFSYEMLLLFQAFLYQQQTSKFQMIFQRYQRMFSSYRFYKDFSIYLDYQLFRVKKGSLSLSLAIDDCMSSLQDSQHHQFLRYQYIFLKKIGKQNIKNHSFRLKLDLNRKSLWLIHLKDEIFNNHRYDLRLNHALLQKIRSYINSISSRIRIYNNTGQTIAQLECFHDCLQREIENIQCFHCKAQCCFENKRLELIILRLKQQFHSAFILGQQLMIYCFKENKMLLSMKELCTNMMGLKGYQAETLLLCYEFIKIAQNPLLYFVRIDSNLHKIYTLLFSASKWQQISVFIDSLTDLLQSKKQKSHTLLFNQQMNLVADSFSNNNEEAVFFFTQHMKLMRFWRKSRNPYVAIYFMSILRARKIKIKRNFLHLFIASRLNNLDWYSRSLMLRSYYQQIISNFSPFPKRQLLYLQKLHSKYRQVQFSVNQITNLKVSKKTKEFSTKITKYMILQRLLIRYHQVCENIA